MKSRFIFFTESYLAETGLVWLAILFYFFCPFYKNFLPDTVRTFLFLSASGYTLLAVPLLYYHSGKGKSSRGLILVSLGIRFLTGMKQYMNKISTGKGYKICDISKEEKMILLFTSVKFIFIPVMLRFAYTNYGTVMTRYAELSASQKPLLQLISDNYFLLAVSFLFLVDTLFFSFGYLVESSLLKNRIKSVDSTFTGWAAALACYPPFNKVTAMFFPLHESFKVSYGNDILTLIIHTIIILLLLVFTFSSVSLGAKCSNLTNRGIVTRGTYRLVRHPAYTAKILIWWLLLIPVIPGHITVVFSLAAWTVIYGIRAVTEELHLLQDQEYIEYCKKVKYRFIPGIF